MSRCKTMQEMRGERPQFENVDGCMVDAIELQACRVVSEDVNGTEYTPTTGDEVPDVYSVYWHLPEGGVDWLCDCVDAQSARMVARALAHTTGLEIFDFIED